MNIHGHKLKAKETLARAKHYEKLQARAANEFDWSQAALMGKRAKMFSKIHKWHLKKIKALKGFNAS